MSLRFLWRMGRIHVGGNLPSPKFCSSTALGTDSSIFERLKELRNRNFCLWFLIFFFVFLACSVLRIIYYFQGLLLSYYFLLLLIRWFSELKGLCFMILFLPWLINLTILFLLLRWSIEETVNWGRSRIIRIHKDPVIFINYLIRSSFVFPHSSLQMRASSEQNTEAKLLKMLAEFD